LIVQLGGGQKARGGSKELRNDVIRREKPQSAFRVHRGDYRRAWFGNSDSNCNHLDLFVIVTALFAKGWLPA
jgi:hypothetical protein